MLAKLIPYLERDVDVRVEHYIKDGVRIPDTFNIYVIHRNKRHMLTNLEWEEIERVSELLEKEDKPIKLWREFGMGQEILDVPRWARPMLAKKLREVKAEEDERIKRELEPEFVAYNVLKITDKRFVFFDYPLLITGVSGTGKTFATKKIISELTNQNHRVAIIDFKNEYKDIIQKHDGISLKNDEADRISEIDQSLVRVIVNLKDNPVDMSFLTVLADKFDYLIIDEATSLYQTAMQNKPVTSLYDVCSSLIKQNLSLKIILSAPPVYALRKEDAHHLQDLFGHHLIFRQREKVVKFPDVYKLEQGEAVFCQKKKPKWFITFKECEYDIKQ